MMNGTMAWVVLKSNEKEAAWLQGEIVLYVKQIEEHYSKGSSDPYIFNGTSQTGYFAQNGKESYCHFIRTCLKSDSRLKYAIKEESSETKEVFYLSNGSDSVDCGIRPVTDKNKIEISDTNEEYINCVFHLAYWFSELMMERLKFRSKYQNLPAFYDIDELAHLLQNPLFETELDIQSYTIDKVFYDVIGLIRFENKLAVEFCTETNVYGFGLHPRYIEHLQAIVRPGWNIFTSAGSIPESADLVCLNWKRWSKDRNLRKKPINNPSPLDVFPKDTDRLWVNSIEHMYNEKMRKEREHDERTWICTDMPRYSSYTSYNSSSTTSCTSGSPDKKTQVLTYDTTHQHTKKKRSTESVDNGEVTRKLKSMSLLEF